jgi:branched-chain amino acid transport system ATP-binding protein
MSESKGANAEYALSCTGITKRFGGLVAVDGVTMDIAPGERRAILGPNGAGKTTLFNLFSGELKPSEGEVSLFGHKVTRMPAHQRTHLGLGRTFQITNLFPSLTVLENLLLAGIGLSRIKYSMLKPLSSSRKYYERADKMLTKVNLIDQRNILVGNLSHGEHRQIEIAMALMSNPRVILLDEPMAGLSSAESNLMTDMISNLDRDMTILIIEHDVDAAFQIADRITVLHQGALFAEGEPEEIRANEKVQEIYFGEA